MCAAAEERVGRSEAGVEFDGASQQLLGFAVARSRVAPPQFASAQEAVIGFQIVGVLGGDPLPVAGVEIERQRGDDLARHVVLDREDVGELPVEAFGPEMSAGRRIDQLRGDPHPVARFAHAPLEDVAHAEAFADLGNVDVLALEGERRIAGDHEELRELRQRGDDVFRDAVGEILLLGVAAHVGERQNGDRRLVGQGGRAADVSRES